MAEKDTGVVSEPTAGTNVASYEIGMLATSTTPSGETLYANMGYTAPAGWNVDFTAPVDTTDPEAVQTDGRLTAKVTDTTKVKDGAVLNVPVIVTIWTGPRPKPSPPSPSLMRTCLPNTFIRSLRKRQRI